MTNVNITIGRFQPLTNGHMACVEEAYTKLHIPTVICMIGVDDSKVDEKHPFPSSMLLPIYQEVFKKNKMIADAKTLRERTIQNQIEKVEQLIIDASNNGYLEVVVQSPLTQETLKYFKDLNFKIKEDEFPNVYYLSWN